MRKSRFTESQIIGILKEAEAGTKVADLAREHGVSTATIYAWHSKCIRRVNPTWTGPGRPPGCPA